MSFYTVTFAHHDLELRDEHLGAHIDWLREMVATGFLVASGPLSDGPLAYTAPVSALLIVKAESKGAALTVIATDPFYIHGITDGLTITEWNPVFGKFATESKGVDSLTTSSAVSSE